MSGLINADNYCSLVLRSSSLFVNINGFVASTLARLCYFNQFDHEAEAVFVYNDNATFVTDFRATLGQRRIHRGIGELLRERQADRFCIQDQTALVISIGKIPPNALVLLEVDVLGEIQTADDGEALVFKTPQILAPFNSEPKEGSASTAAYKFDLKIRSDIPCQLAGCYSPSHAIRVDADANATSAETVIITLAEEFKHDQQIRVYFYPAKPFDVYTSIEAAIGLAQEVYSSPKHARYSAMSSANTQTATDSLRNSFLRKKSFVRNENLTPKAQEYKEVLTSDNVTKIVGKDLPHDTTNETVFHKRQYGQRMPSAFHVLKNPNSVNSSFEKKTSHSTRPQKIYQTRFSLPDIVFRKNSLSKNNSDQSFAKHEYGAEDTASNSHSKDHIPFKEMLKSNGKDILFDDKVQDLNSADAEWSKEVRKHSKVDVKNVVDNARCVVVENSNATSRSSNHLRPRHYLSDSIVAASFLPDLSNYPVCGEYVFMLDRSGSMNGSHICNAKESLVLFLKSLPTTSYFNVVSFGSYSRSLFPCSQRYSQDSLEKGCVYVNGIKADMGGSDLLEPLKAVLEKPPKSGYMRNVFLLTDGDIAEPDAILRYLKTKRHNARIFTFGIGPKISYDTVRDIARDGHGEAYFSEQGTKTQCKVIQCLKEILKPTLCEIKVEWQLPSNWELLRATPEIPFSLAGQRINVYASVQLPFRAQWRLGEKRNSVKEFWFDDEIDSCQLGDNVFFEDFQDNGEFSGYWGTDTDTTASDCEQQCDERVGSDREEVGSVRNEDFESVKKIAMTKSNVEDVVKNWREVRSVRLYSSDTSTETEDEGQSDGLYHCGIPHTQYSKTMDMNGAMSPPEKDISQKNCDLNHNSVNIDEGMNATDDVINKLAHVTDMRTEYCLAKTEGMADKNMDVATTKTSIFPLDTAGEFRHLNNDVMRNDVICNRVAYNDVTPNDVTPNDVTSLYFTDTDKQLEQKEIHAKSCNPLNVDINSTFPIKKSKENVIDSDDFESTPCDKYERHDDFNECKNLSNTDCGSVLITGYIGPDVHRERIPLCFDVNTNTSNGISLHQIAAKKFITDMEAILESTSNTPGVEQEMIALSKESGVLSSMTSLTTIDDTGNLVGVYQNMDFAIRRRKLLPGNSPKLNKRDENPPAILVSCPSVDEEPRSPTKRRHGMSTEADPISDDGKYYRIERLDPEGCDQVKRETRRKRYVDCRTIPIKAIQRRKVVSTRLTLLSRKMRNANKLNVFAGPPFIRLILLQSAEGFWQLTYAFARIIGLPLVQLELAAPFVDSTMIPLSEQDDRLGIDCYYDSLALWATALALVHLRRKWRSHEKDWELVAAKAEAWLKTQTFPQGFGYTDVILAAKQAIVLLEQKYRSRAKSEPVCLME